MLRTIGKHSNLNKLLRQSSVRTPSLDGSFAVCGVDQRAPLGRDKMLRLDLNLISKLLKILIENKEKFFLSNSEEKKKIIVHLNIF